MKKTCYTLLVGLASLVLAGAQTNDDIQPAPAADTTNAMAAEAPAASPSAMAETNAAATESPAPPAASVPGNNASSIAYSNLIQALATTNEAMPQAASGEPSATEGTTSAAGATDEAAETTSTSETVANTTTNSTLTAETTNMENNAGTKSEMTGTNSSATTASAEETETNAPAVAVGIPQIKFSDVPITTAIENLARLANINYMLDPKIGYGQPDANGQIKVEPTLSIRWENITAENALLALLDNYGLQLIRDKKTKIDRITMKDPTAPPPLFTKVVQLKYAGVSNILAAAESVLTDKRSKVLTDPRTSQLIVVATDPEQQAVETLVTQLDKPTRQVLIETRLVEVSSNPQTSKGVDWTGTLGGQNVSFGNNVDGGQGGRYSHTQTYETNSVTGGYNVLNNYGPNSLLNTPGLLADTAKGLNPSTFFLDADGLSAVLSFLNTSTDAKVVSTPRIVTLDNETANISVTRTYPIFTVQAGTQNTAGGSSVTYSNVGTVLAVTPRISANDYIWLSVVPEVSSFFGNFSANIGGTVFQAPQFDTRTIRTDVLVPNSNTLVLGGLVQDSPRANYTKVPVLGDIPGLGFFFRSENKSLSKDNLLIFITPTIVKDSDFQPTQSSFLKSTPPAQKDSMDPSTSWDGAQPKGDWSNPINKYSQ